MTHPFGASHCRRCGAPLSMEGPYCPECGTVQVRPDRWSWRGVLPPRQAGWFNDPASQNRYRYWNGETWTDFVYPTNGGPMANATRDPMSLVPRTEESRNALDRLRPRGSLGLAFAGLFVAFGLSGFTATLWGTIGHPGGAIVVLAASEIGLWAGLFYTCWLISARFGTHNLRKDFNLSIRWFDIIIGFAGGALGRYFSSLIASAFVGPNSGGGSHQVLGVSMTGILDWAILIAIVCVGAPFFEELFFRGLLQGELSRRFGPWIGIPLTAIIFGSAHVFNATGFAGVIYALSVMGGGIVLGVVYGLTRRLGASMATHAFFNALAFTAFASWAIH